MKKTRTALVMMSALFLCMGSLSVQADELDVTMEIVESPDQIPEAITQTLTLPPAALNNSPVAEERSAFGLETASQARNKAQAKGKEFGQSVAEQAKQKGKGKGKGKP